MIRLRLHGRSERYRSKGRSTFHPLNYYDLMYRSPGSMALASRRKHAACHRDVIGIQACWLPSGTVEEQGTRQPNATYFISINWALNEYTRFIYRPHVADPADLAMGKGSRIRHKRPKMHFLTTVYVEGKINFRWNPQRDYSFFSFFLCWVLW